MREVQKSRIHLKMMAGDYFTYQINADQSGGSAHCRCCADPSKPAENLKHILTICSAYTHIRQRMAREYEYICSQSKSNLSFQKIYSDNELFCQFILDPASFNLPNRIHLADPVHVPLFQVSRDYCYAVNSARMKLLDKSQSSDIIPQQ